MSMGNWPGAVLHGRGLRIVLAAIIATLCVYWTLNVTGAPIVSDASANLKMGLNLAHHGTMSLSSETPLQPSMYREPLPIFVIAAGILIVDALVGRADSLEDYFSGDRARYLKYSNVLWMLLLVAGVYCAVRFLTGSTTLAVVGMVLMNLKVPATPTSVAALGIDELMSDLAAAAIMVWASLLLVRALRDSRRLHFAITGAVFGLLALVKAAFLYVVAGVVVGTLVLSALNRWQTSDKWRVAAAQTLILTACFAVVVLPWMLRNYAQLGVFGIAERGGVVLLMRAEKDRMNAVEYRGAFYVWAPPKLQSFFGSIFGFSREDLQRHGRLERLNREINTPFFAHEMEAEMAGRPDDAVTFYHKARAQRVQLLREYAAMSTPPERTVDEVLQERAMNMILDRPGKHLATTVPFLWRGAFTVFPILMIALLYSAYRRRVTIAAFVLPAFGLVMFCALLTHFPARYSVPTVGVAISVLLAMLKLGSDAIMKRVRTNFGTGIPERTAADT